MTDAVVDVSALRALVEEFERQRTEAPPGYRPALGLASHFLADWVDAIEDGDAEGRANALDLLRNGPMWLQELPRLPQILDYVTVDEDPLAGVRIDWHRVPDDLRAATVSLASMVVDAARGQYQPGGRPKK